MTAPIKPKETKPQDETVVSIGEVANDVLKKLRAKLDARK